MQRFPLLAYSFRPRYFLFRIFTFHIILQYRHLYYVLHSNLCPSLLQVSHILTVVATADYCCVCAVCCTTCYNTAADIQRTGTRSVLVVLLGGLYPREIDGESLTTSSESTDIEIICTLVFI